MKFFSKHKIQDNPNPNATIGFLCWNPFHYYVYKNIYRSLPEAEFVVGKRIYWSKGLEDENIKNVGLFLNEKKARWRFFDEGRLSYDEKREFFQRYRAIVSTWEIREPLLSGMLDGVLRLRALYGNAKDFYNFGLWSADFDLILTYGPYSQKFLEVYTNAKIVGNPKFDDWFNQDFDRAFMDSLRVRLDPAKKTILYLPTHDSQKGLSSLPALVREAAPALEEYNFLLKLHYLTRLDEKKLVAELEQKGFFIFDERHDILPLLKTADYVLSDNSGAIFDAILAGKPVILFETPAGVFDKKMFVTTRGVSGLATYPGSLEQKIKSGGLAAGPVIRSFQDLPGAVLQWETRRAFFEANAKRISSMVYGYRDGRCGERAAREIVNLIKNFPELSKRYPFIYYARRREILKIRGLLDTQAVAPFFTKLQLIFRSYFWKE